MSPQENEAIFWKYFASELKRVYPLESFIEEKDFGNEVENVKLLWKHSQREDWHAFTPGLLWPMETIAKVACKIGTGFRFEVIKDPAGAHNWRQDQYGETDLAGAIIPVRPNCQVCKSKVLIEIELCLSKGMGLAKLAKLFKFSESQLSAHRRLCSRERLERLGEALGFMMDTETLLGAAGKLDKAFQISSKLAELAGDRGDFVEARACVDQIMKNADMSAELSGEKEKPQAVGQGGMGGQGMLPGSVNVVVMPTQQAPRRPTVIDGTVVDDGG